MANRIPVAAIVCLLVPNFARAQIPEYVHIDFSQYPEGTEISEQYAAYGVHFSLADGPGYPIIAQAGPPAAAFVTDAGGADVLDAPFGLTDPLGPNGEVDMFRPIRIDFDPPVFSVRYWLPAIGNHDARAFYGDPLRGRNFTACGTFETTANANPGRQPIRRVQIVAPASGPSGGYAIVGLTVTRLPQQPLANLVQVAQESSPGAGDFDLHPLGVIRPWHSPPGLGPRMADFYLYGKTYNSVSFGGPRVLQMLQPGESRIEFVDAFEGPSLVVIHSRPNPCVSPDGPAGHAEMRVRLSGVTGPLAVTLRDDPDSDSYVLSPDQQSLVAVSSWDQRNTDGFALSGLTGDWTALVDFEEADGNAATPPIDGLTGWTAFSSERQTIALALEPGRRVRFRPLAACAIPGDGNCDGLVNNFDIDAFVAAILGNGSIEPPAEYLAAGGDAECWGQRRCWADLDGDGQVNNFDIDSFVACVLSPPPPNTSCH